jgi:peptidoglycan/LPS O-acetylase OafA/YrhL
LRAFAATGVVAFHATLAWWRISGGIPLKKVADFWWSGAAGVDLFFVISGFVMTVSTYGKERQPRIARHFVERRAIRLFPMYWIMTSAFALELLVLNFFPAWKTSGESYARLSPGFFFGSLTLVPFDHDGNTDPLVAVGWTLSYEILFYLLFAVALKLRIKPLQFLAPAMLLLLAAAHFRGANWPAFTLLANPLLLEFLAGVVVGVAIMRGFRMRTVWGLLLAGAGLAMILVPRTGFPHHRAVLWGQPATMVVLGISSIEETFSGFWPQWVLLLGDASYSLYLSHVLVLHAVARAFEFGNLIPYRIERRGDEVLLALTCVAIALPFSVVLYKTVEQPVTNILRRRLLGEGPPQSEKHPEENKAIAA